MSNMSSIFGPADTMAKVYFVASPNTGPGYQIYTEEDLKAFGGVHSLERTLEIESYWFIHLGEVPVTHGSSGVCFKDSDLAFLPQPPEHTWKIGRRNPAFGRPELDRYVFRAGFKAVEQMLDLWKQRDEGVVDAYALKELKLTPQRLKALMSALITLQKTQEIVEITVMKYWYDSSWLGRQFPCDLVTAEFSFKVRFNSDGPVLTDCSTSRSCTSLCAEAESLQTPTSTDVDGGQVLRKIAKQSRA